MHIEPTDDKITQCDKTFGLGMLNESHFSFHMNLNNTDRRLYTRLIIVIVLYTD